MKKKVIRLTEQDVENLVKKIIKEDGGFDWAEGIQDYKLKFYYSTGEEDYGDEDYDSSQYVEGLLEAQIPKSKFVEIMGIDYIEEVDPFNEEGGGRLLDYMLANYHKSINTSTGENMEPDIEWGWTQGMITVE